MKNTSKYLFAFLLFLFPFLCRAENKPVIPKGGGTRTDPYQIKTIENLVWLSSHLSDLAPLKYISLENDIDASETETWNDGAGFVPIAGFDDPDVYYEIKVNFNGNGHTISGLHIDRSVSNDFNLGLFSSLKDSKIYDLVISNAFISGNKQLGAIAGFAERTSFENCRVVGSFIKGEDKDVGGLVGRCGRGNAFISCEFDGKLSGVDHLGGIAGKAFYSKFTEFTDLSSKVEIIRGRECIGGIIGYAGAAKILRCASEIDCSSDTNVYGYVGGIIGFSGIDNSSGVDIRFCYAKAKIKGESHIGGLAGSWTGTKEENIENCYAVCELTASAPNYACVGGIVGLFGDQGSVINCYSLGDICVEAEKYFGGIAGNENNLFGRAVISNCFHSMRPMEDWENARAEMKMKSTYVGWDFDEVWDMDDGEDFPYLRWEVPEPTSVLALFALLISFAYSEKRQGV